MTLKELMKKFREEMKEQILKEYKKTGRINTKIVLLAVDDEKTPVLCVKKIPSVCSNIGDDFYEEFVKSQKSIKKLIKNVEEDGYTILSSYEMEFVEDKDEEYVFTRMKYGTNLDKTDIKNYQFVKQPSIVSENGEIVIGTTTLEQIVD